MLVLVVVVVVVVTYDKHNIWLDTAPRPLAAVPVGSCLTATNRLDSGNELM